jgi:hypothetical protein
MRYPCRDLKTQDQRITHAWNRTSRGVVVLFIREKQAGCRHRHIQDSSYAPSSSSPSSTGKSMGPCLFCLPLQRWEGVETRICARCKILKVRALSIGSGAMLAIITLCRTRVSCPLLLVHLIGDGLVGDIEEGGGCHLEWWI